MGTGLAFTMLEALKNIEKVEKLSRADSEVTVATVDTFLSDTTTVDINTHTDGASGGNGGIQPSDNTGVNTDHLLKKGRVYHFYHRHIGTIIVTSTYMKTLFLIKIGNVKME